jgi:hypothetical protein
MLGHSLINAATFSSLGRSSSLKRKASFADLSELSAATEDEFVPSIVVKDDDYFEAYLLQESSTCISSGPLSDSTLLVIPSVINVNWIKTDLVPKLQNGFKMNQTGFERVSTTL